MRYAVLFVLGVLAAISGFAAEEGPAEDIEPSGAIGQPKTGPTGNVTGAVELRPSWHGERTELRSENSLAVGYQFNPDRSLGLVYDFNTVFANANNPELNNTLRSVDMFVRAQLNRIWAHGRATLSYEPRIYIPVETRTRQRGMLTMIRNYVKLAYNASPNINVTLVEMPILHVYSHLGHDSGSEVRASPLFENRFYFITDLSFGNLSISLPVMFHATRYANFRSDAENNDSWDFFAWVWPEVTYQVAPKVSLGVAFYNWESLVASDLSSLELEKGFASGVWQVIVAATL